RLCGLFDPFFMTPHEHPKCLINAQILGSKLAAKTAKFGASQTKGRRFARESRCDPRRNKKKSLRRM
ncbi:MAG TPA: hypothetical protein PLS03_07400, partial [Terrimicrobiaceae bacterium]|nr:hypothetical protein [Terrimicrobiaceae bacterium]